MKFQNILVGVADDEASAIALHGAAQLAAALAAELHVVHVVDDDAAEADALSRVHETAVRALAGTALAETWSEEQLVVEQGEPTVVLSHQAAVVAADLLVVGPHRKRRFDFGSTAKGLLSHGATPTLIQIGAARQRGTLMVALDLNPGSKETLQVAHSLASELEAKLVLLHCYEGPAFAYESGAGDTTATPNYVIESERKREAEEFEAFVNGFEWGAVEFESIFLEGDPASQILERQDEFDMIVVGRQRSHGIFGSLGSLSGRLHKVIDCPLLIIPHE